MFASKIVITIGQSGEIIKSLADKLELGDYISMTPTSTSYIIPAGVTGYEESQEINPSELNLWRVIRKNNDGTVDVVSEYVSSEKVIFKGKTEYMNGVGVLNTIAAQYTDGKHVASTRHIGYSNQTETITDTSMLSETSASWTKDTSIYNQWTGCDTSRYLCGTDEAKGAGDVGYETDYNLVSAVYGSMVANNPSETATSYWLASLRFTRYGSTYWNFNGRYVDTSGGLRINNLYYYNSGFGNTETSYAVRPIATLKSTADKLSGEGTG